MALVERYNTQGGKAAEVLKSQEQAGASPSSDGTAHLPHRQAVSLVRFAERAERVGILGMEVYFPNVYVRLK